jgi:heterodisulfide reductase subunit A
MTRLSNNLAGKRVAVIGGGIAGLTAARDLARLGAGVVLVEKSDALGGHAAGFGCKAAERCVKCGACMVEAAVREVEAASGIQVHRPGVLDAVRRNGRFSLTLVPAAESGPIEADAVVVATGFSPYDPREQPYGYKQFPNVITNLELEAMIRGTDALVRPSDGAAPDTMAFVQCVGSRDAKLDHLWCSRVCCGSALRMARWIRARRPETAVTFFYIDVQTFGKDFETFYKEAKTDVTLIRNLPADLYPAPEDRLKAVYFDPDDQKPGEAVFDMVVLSIGLMPGVDNPALSALLDTALTEDGFMAGPADAGVFPTGTALGPMSIPDAVRSAEKTVRDVVRYLEASQ